MTDIHDNANVSSKEAEIERTSSISQQKIRYTHDQKRFIKVFPELIQEASTLGTVCSCNLERDVLWQGKIYPTAYHICFYGKIFAKAAKVTIHFKDITQIEKRSTVGMFPNAIRINTANIEYVFSSFLKRDVTYQAFCDAWHRIKSNNELHSNDSITNISLNNQNHNNETNEPIKKHIKSNSLSHIDPINFVQDEFKRNNNEEEVAVLSQSYPERSPIENAYISSQSESELVTNESSQSFNDGLQNKLLDIIYNIDSKGLYQLVFEDNSKILYDVYKSANNDNIRIGLWKKDPRTNLKERVIINVFIESEIMILNLNYSECFKTICKYFIISEKEDYSRLLVTFEIKFNKKFAYSDKVKKTMFDNYNQIIMELENYINKNIKKITNENNKDMNSSEDAHMVNEVLSNNNEKLTNEMDDSIYDTIKSKPENSISPSESKFETESEKNNDMNTLFNVKIFRTPFFNYILDAVFLIFNVLIYFSTVLINIMNYVISLIKPQDQKRSKKKNKDDKKILTSAPYLVIILGILLLIGIIITISNAYYAYQLQGLEKIIENRNNFKIDPSTLSKFSDDLLKNSDAISDDQKIIQSLVGSSYERYNDILGQYNKQKDKHTENLNFSYLRLNQQLELMNKKFNVMKQDIDSILKDFSNEGLVNLINELEQNNEKNQ
ncbi:hypothetical protein LY90DRAFT_513242 [Neocallimastix californiae]|uniref:VASt domain-containing protein n=1 Tax=Neocallimastix californiae TaxID=1754190 RepID=A0A1Y2AZV8_9FUNG|nr:hypothetical protein LY90DRAFT_513242 [Neocallimastix californiae]|eukprot:ORY28103.1 hypothetical protein LY90DRAFT_513242 [Neocallimastix californiae]